MTDNVAILEGYTKEVWGECAIAEGPFLVKPDADLDDFVKVWDMDNQEFIRLRGWLWTFTETPNALAP